MTPADQTAKNLTLIGCSDIGGHPDALQVMVEGGYAFVSHPFSGGFSVLDVSDPRQITVAVHVPAPAGTRTLHLQLAHGFLLVTNEADTVQSARYGDQAAYYGRQLGADAASGLDFAAGVRVYDVTRPAEPREVAFLALGGFGAHRIFWTGGPVATVSAMPPRFPDFILTLADLSDPARPRELGRWWPEELEPGNGAASARVGLHHAILAEGLAFGAWRDGGLHIVDATDAGRPRRIGGLGPSAWGGGQTHTTLPLPGRGLVVAADEAVLERCADGERRIWLIDVADPAAPRVVAALPAPAEADYCAAGGRFGPHNLHENRPGSWVSETVVFATYQNAGVRVYDISEPGRPAEIGFIVPPPPGRIVDPRSRGGSLVAQSTDVFVSAEGLVYVTDFNSGLAIAEFRG